MGNEQLDTGQLIKKVKLLEAIVNKTHEGILVFNHHFEVVYANVAAGKILGAEPITLRKKSLDDFIPSDRRAKHQKLAGLFSASQETRQELYDWRSIECCKVDGTQFPARITVEKLPIAVENIFIVSLVDMTDYLKVEREKCIAELDQFRMEQQRNYALGTLQVNLDQTLNKIAKSAQTIKQNFAVKAVRDAMTGIMNNAFSALSLSQKAIYISSQQKNTRGLKMVDQSLKGIVERIKLHVESNSEKKHLKITWDIPAAAKEFEVKENQKLEQILFNMIEDTVGNSIGGNVIFQLQNLHYNSNNSIHLEFHCQNPSFGVPQQIIDQVIMASSKASIPARNNLFNGGMCLRLAKYLTEELNGNLRIISHPIIGTEIFLSLDMMQGGKPKKQKNKNVKKSEEQTKTENNIEGEKESVTN